ncbi:hypothetical protein J437_LFUL015320 [Ladona fulva]|uniref:Mannose-P-dolichol utilization defect 1 protein homolog n=1 Tax=Ladona fulva TaxID=123851 RepID=A0A8K0P600_LADFU|nr:hypothetical protein J437_LFUL015320 [Ladona fulva]
MSGLARNISVLLFTEECHESFFVDFDFFNGVCLKTAISKILGIGIIAGSMLVKVPQILKIQNAKSAEGISIPSVFLELFAISASMAYSYMSAFPFSAWGEGLFLALQTATIVALAFLYGGEKNTRGIRREQRERNPSQAGLFLIGYATFMYILLSGITSVEILRTFQAANVPVILLGKSLQAVSNYKRGSTGQLSAATLGLLFAGSLARIFTSIQETGDRTLVITYAAASFANGVIFLQILYYGRKKQVKIE